MFTNYNEIGEDPSVETEYTFKRSKLFDDDKLIKVYPKDILNIRSEFNTTALGLNRPIKSNLNYDINSSIDEFFTYHATILLGFTGSTIYSGENI